MMQPRMLVVARESRGLTQTQLAQSANVPQGTLSKAENGFVELTEDRIDAIAQVLSYPSDIFDWPDEVYGFGSSSFHHRKQQSLPQNVLRQAQAKVNFLRMRLRRLSDGLDIRSRTSIPALSLEDVGSPEEAARVVRAVWNVPMGPIESVTSCLESAGAFVLRRDLGPHRISAISMKLADERPLFVLNYGLPSDRERFTLAHELGHLVLHEVPVGEVEDEADRFAAELLMPAREIRHQLSGIDVARAVQLKQYWRVSMAALIKRSYDLDVITNPRYRSLYTQMSQAGYLRKEPVDIPREDSKLLSAMLNVHFNEHRYSSKELSKLVGLFEGEFSNEFPIQSTGLRLVR